jgi:carboxypeptidase C (cathepsin A)
VGTEGISLDAALICEQLFLKGAGGKSGTRHELEAMADEQKSKSEATPSDEQDNAKGDRKPVFEDETPVETTHDITIGDRTLHYRVTAGRLPLKNHSQDKPETEAQVFFTYYALQNDSTGDSEKKKKKDLAPPATADRPLTFAFNGGPGSASVWLHLGALGPQCVVLNPDGSLPPPPYRLQPNSDTWLTETDLVFIDPVGTGYSRAKDDETAKKYYEVDGDIASIAEFVRLFLTRYQRWASPLFLAGESYGTTRGAGLAGYLMDRGIAFTGILLISSVLSLQTIRFQPGNDLPFALYLPAYTATAWYHKRLEGDLQARDLTDVLREAEAFAFGPYSSALMQGDRLPADQRADVIRDVARFTGLSEKYVEQRDLRIEHWRFCKELLRSEGVTVGRIDSRLTARESNNAGEMPSFDSSMLNPVFTAGINDYLGRTLGYKTDLPYAVAGDGVNGQWKWANGSFTETATPLAKALAKNPHLRVLFTCGYYDLATPYSAAEYTANHLGIDPAYRENLSFTYYPAGHMMYIEQESRAQLRRDVADFIRGEKQTSPK